MLDTSDYLQRLRTVYELGTALTFRVVPTTLPVNFYAVIAVLSAAMTVANFFAFVLKMRFVHEHLPFPASSFSIDVLFFGGMGLPVTVSLMRSWAREQHSRLVRLQSFSINNAICSVEADRLPVYKNIQTMLESQELIPPSASTDEALHCFDDLVRNELPHPVQASNVYWQHCFAVSSTFFLVWPLTIWPPTLQQERRGESQWRGSCIS